ncbi:MAG: response regulator [Bacteroidales bacterium]
MEKRTILIAEDIDNNFDLLNIILRKEYNLVRAINGVEVVKLYPEVNPDIILMDMKMPEMGGLEATRLIRMQSKTVPIIAVTAFAFESDREVALQAGCDDFLSKPIDIPVLKSVIKKFMKKVS